MKRPKSGGKARHRIWMTFPRFFAGVSREMIGRSFFSTSRLSESDCPIQRRRGTLRCRAQHRRLFQFGHGATEQIGFGSIRPTLELGSHFSYSHSYPRSKDSFSFGELTRAASAGQLFPAALAGF